jgi:hypothetical protein
MRNEIIEYCAVDILEENMFLDRIFDDAILGICYTMSEGFTPAYDLDRVVKKIKDIEKTTDEMAITKFNNLIETHPMISFIKYINESWDDLSLYNNEMLFLNDYDDKTLVGVRFKHECNIISVYDDYLCIQSLIENDGMEEEDAIEYFEYNTRGSHVGDNTPAFLTLL